MVEASYGKMTDTMQGPVGLLDFPHFLGYRKQPSFSLHTFPEFQEGRFKQLLIR